MERRLIQRLAVPVLLALVLLSSGCPATDPYRACLQSSAKVSDVVHTAIEAMVSGYATGKLDDSEKAVVAQYLQNVTEANMTFRKSVNDLHTTGVKGSAEYLGLAQAFVNAVPADPLAFHYKSVDSQKKFAVVLGAVKAALNAIQLAIQNAKGGV